MNYIKAIILAIVQGLTEFLPVSSSGHLIIAQDILGAEEEIFDIFFDTLLHFGTLCAVVFAYRKTVFRLISVGFSSVIPLFQGKINPKTATYEQKMIFFIIISLLPLFLVLPFKDTLESLYSSTLFVGIALIATSIFLFISDKIIPGKKKADNMTIKNAAAIGFVQTFAVLPGISRSGSTITAGIAVGLDRQFAAEFSFIMSIPTILASLLLQIFDIAKDGINTSLLPVYVCGMFFAAVSGFFAIKLLEILLKSKKFIYFSIYCLLAGIFAIIWNFI